MEYDLSHLPFALLMFVVLSALCYLGVLWLDRWMAAYGMRRNERLRREEEAAFEAEVGHLIPTLLTRHRLTCYMNPSESRVPLGQYLPLHHSLFLEECGRMKPSFGLRTIRAFYRERVALLDTLFGKPLPALAYSAIAESLWLLLLPRVVFRGHDDDEGQHYEDESDDPLCYVTQAPFRALYLRALAEILPTLVKFEQRGSSSYLVRRLAMQADNEKKQKMTTTRDKKNA